MMEKPAAIGLKSLEKKLFQWSLTMMSFLATHMHFFMFTFLLKQIYFWGHPLSSYAKFSEKLTFLTPLSPYQQVRNVNFLENFA